MLPVSIPVQLTAHIYANLFKIFSVWQILYLWYKIFNLLLSKMCWAELCTAMSYPTEKCILEVAIKLIL